MSAAVAAMTARINAGTRSYAWPYVVIFLGFAVGSCGPLLIRAVHVAGMPTLAVVAGRQLISSLMLTPFVLRYHRHELQHLSRRNLVFALLAGIVLAVRFYFQFEAFNNSSVLLTGVFGGSGPLWVALIEVLLLRAVFTRRIWAGVLLSLAGGVIIAIAGFDGGTSPGNNAVLGAVYALTAAFLSAFYLNFGRLARGQISFWPYLWLIFSIAAVVSVTVAIAAGVPLTGYSTDAWLALIASDHHRPVLRPRLHELRTGLYASHFHQRVRPGLHGDQRSWSLHRVQREAGQRPGDWQPDHYRRGYAGDIRPPASETGL